MVPMKIHEETFTALNGSCAEPGQLFFDIESTGLNPSYAAVYLIGCSWFEDGEWQLRLYFADDRRAECDVLRTFADLLRGFSTVVHFNGDRFDIPFLQERMARYGLGDPFAGMESIDLLKRVRPYKKLLGVENLKQKTLERFLGIDREDLFGGGELIQVYEEYLYSEDPRLEHFLLLHNLEDVKGMSELTALLRIPEWMEGRFELCGCCAGGNDTEDVSDTASEFNIGRSERRECWWLVVGEWCSVGKVTVSQFERDQFAKTEVTDTRDEVKENTLTIPFGMQREVFIGSVLEIIHQGKTERIIGIALVALKMVQKWIWHLPKYYTRQKSIIERSTHA